MTRSHLLALTTCALLAAGSAFAGPNCKKNCPKDDGISGEGVYEVAEREGGEAKPERRERGERGERAEGDRKRPERREHSPLQGLGLSEEQHEQAKAIMGAAREQAEAILKEAKAKKEAGEEVDREAVREQLMEIRKGAMKNVYDNVLNDEQRAKMDERREKMEEHRKEREGKEGERPRKGKDGERPGKDRGGDGGLDL